jgi:hypothetical protein
MAGEAGWAEIGGRMIRKPEYEGDPNPPVIGRTKWLPKADWWPGRVGKLNEDQTREAVRKALAGEKLKKNEQAAIDYMIDVANERRAERSSIHDEEWAAIAEDVRAEGSSPPTRTWSTRTSWRARPRSTRQQLKERPHSTRMMIVPSLPKSKGSSVTTKKKRVPLLMAAARRVLARRKKVAQPSS